MGISDSNVGAGLQEDFSCGPCPVSGKALGAACLGRARERVLQIYIRSVCLRAWRLLGLVHLAVGPLPLSGRRPGPAPPGDPRKGCYAACLFHRVSCTAPLSQTKDLGLGSPKTPAAIHHDGPVTATMIGDQDPVNEVCA